MASPENRADIRNKIRARLSAWPEDSGLLDSSGIASVGVTTFSLAAALDIAEKALLQIDSEVLRVRTYTAGGALVASVIRGYKGSTAAVHAAAAAVQIFPQWGWTDFDINTEIDAAIDWLYPDYWVLLTKTNTLLKGNTDFGLPAGAVYPQGAIVKRLELLDSSVSPAVYREILGWKHAGDRLVLERATVQDYSARLWLQTPQARLANDSAQLASSDPVEAIVYYAASNLLEQLLANRTRYTEYSAALNDRASTPDELQRTAYYYKNQAVVARDRIARAPLSGMASTRRNG